MFSEAKVGDRVFGYTHQKWGTIKKINADATYSIWVTFQGNVEDSFTYQGYMNAIHGVPVLFWDEVKPLTPPKKPLPKLDIDTKMLVWDNGSDKIRKRYFSHFDKDRRPNCFLDGKTSWTEKKTAAWDNWDLPKPDLSENCH